MSVAELITKNLFDSGLSAEEAVRIVTQLQANPAMSAMKQRWSDAASEYPESLMVVVWLSAARAALTYIDAECPSHWARAIFAKEASMSAPEAQAAPLALRIAEAITDKWQVGESTRFSGDPSDWDAAEAKDLAAAIESAGLAALLAQNEALRALLEKLTNAAEKLEVGFAISSVETQWALANAATEARAALAQTKGVA